MESNIFPLVLPLDRDCLSYQGFITIKKCEFFIKILLDKNNAPALRNAKIYGSPEFKQLIFGHDKILKQRLEQCYNIDEFFIDLKDLLEHLMIKEKEEVMPPGIYYSSLLSELDKIGWDKLELLDPSLKSLVLRLNHSSGRQHKINITLPFSYPKSPLIIQAEIPSEIQLNCIFDLNEEIEKFQEFWSMLDDVDQNTWILEPDKPKRNDLIRRIALGNHCSLQIKVNPQHPKDVCELKNTSLNIRQNLENILEIKFPSSQSSSSPGADYEIECGICYTYHLESSIPEYSCNNSKCGRLFHQICLSESITIQNKKL
ncbi:15139_t:CDS:2 [Entrophospora sp. SA101]|nr:15139_t:CDS:2 [Entrophospora sp. SA101]